MVDKEKILAGRKAVDAYRKAHRQLHSKPWHRGIPEEHTPLLNIMVKAFKGLSFNTIQEFFDASRECCLIGTGIFDHPIYRGRRELVMLGQPAELNGVELKQVDYGRNLVIDGKFVMNTSIGEHVSMMMSVKECPNNARVFVGGLGLGILLLYLAYSEKAREVLVCEKDERVISLLGECITNYLVMPIQIVHGDAFEQIKTNGKFDWIYIDLTEGAPLEFEALSKVALTENGVYTPYSPHNWRVWR